MGEQIFIKTRKGSKVSSEGIPIQINFHDQSLTLLQLKKQISSITRIHPLQQWLTFEDFKTVLDDNQKPLHLYRLKNQQILVVKDLGPQMLWKTVFYVEYLGPILVYSSLYLLGNKQTYSLTQKCAFFMGIGHFLKRELETCFIHVFSRDSMPVKRALMNCFHYWILFGFNVGLELFKLKKFPDKNLSLAQKILLFAFIGFELLNFLCHTKLAGYRKKKKTTDKYDGTEKKRAIPYGLGFTQVSSANYLWETLAWTSFSAFSQSYAGCFFTIVSFIQMLIWAREKHRRYKKEFGSQFPRFRILQITFKEIEKP